MNLRRIEGYHFDVSNPHKTPFKYLSKEDKKSFAKARIEGRLELYFYSDRDGDLWIPCECKYKCNNATIYRIKE